MLEVLQLDNYEDMHMDVNLFVYLVQFHCNLLLLLHMTMLDMTDVLLLLRHVLYMLVLFHLFHLVKLLPEMTLTVLWSLCHSYVTSSIIGVLHLSNNSNSSSNFAIVIFLFNSLLIIRNFSSCIGSRF